MAGRRGVSVASIEPAQRYKSCWFVVMILSCCRQCRLGAREGALDRQLDPFEQVPHHRLLVFVINGGIGHCESGNNQAFIGLLPGH